MSGKKKRDGTPAGRPAPGKKTGGGWQRRLKVFLVRYKLAVRACLIFFITVGLFLFLYNRIVTTPSFDVVLNFTAAATGLVLNLLGQGVAVENSVVSTSRFAFQVVGNLCTAVMPALIFTAAVLAFPAKLLEKFSGLCLGLIGIFLINEVRLVSLFFIGIYAPRIFEITHLLIWQSLMILFALGFWLLWAYKYVRATAI